jgi:hypothetical protein
VDRHGCLGGRREAVFEHTWWGQARILLSVTVDDHAEPLLATSLMLAASDHGRLERDASGAGECFDVAVAADVEGWCGVAA